LAEISSEIDRFKRNGITKNSSKLQELESQYQEYSNKIKSIYQSIFEASISDIESDIFKTQRQEGTENQQVDLYKKAQDLILKEMNRYSDLTVAGNEEKLRELEKQYYDYSDKIKSVYESLKTQQEELVSAATGLIDYEIDKIQKKIDLLEEQNRLIETRIKLLETEISTTARSINDADAVICPSTRIRAAGIDPNSFIAEDMNTKNFPVGLTVDAKSVDEAWVKDAMAILSSDQMRAKFDQTFGGTLVLYPKA
jgi:uncharacterized protein YukE